MILSIFTLYFCGMCVNSDLIPNNGSVIDLSHYGTKMYGEPDFNYGKMLEANLTNVNPLESGPYLEGDLLIPHGAPRNGIIGESYRWPGGIIPVVISNNFSPKVKKMIIDQCMGMYLKYTCIRFRDATNKDTNYVYIDNQRAGCYSGIGMNRGVNIINLQEGACTSHVGTCIHEFMHAVGFFHEQARSDRDSYVRINWQNIRQGMEGNFDKQQPGRVYDQGVSYDYDSIMHYSLYSHSKNGAPTMTALYKTDFNIGHEAMFSIKDIMKINRMYKCPRSYTQ